MDAHFTVRIPPHISYIYFISNFSRSFKRKLSQTKTIMRKRIAKFQRQRLLKKFLSGD